MYIDTSHITRGGKTYTRHLLRESYRAHGKVLHRTIANVSHCSATEIEAMRLALRHKDDLEHLGTIQDAITLTQGVSFGAVWTVYHIARRLGIEKALGTTRAGKLALWQVVARVLDQGSRLSAVRLAMSHAACDVLGLDAFDEDALYENLDWLAGAQAAIEDRLFAQRTKTQPVRLFLYDVTSSYLEGTHNALAAFGYNRDGKKGKMQLVIGLLCDEAGYPVSIEVFPGNTQDPHTFAAQLNKVKARFGVTEITFVGDRGMIKGQQIKTSSSRGAITLRPLRNPRLKHCCGQAPFKWTSSIRRWPRCSQMRVSAMCCGGIRYGPKKSGTPGTPNWPRSRRWLASTINTSQTIRAPSLRGLGRSSWPAPQHYASLTGSS